MVDFELVSAFEPAGGQPAAIDALTKNYLEGKKQQTLLGITGSGKSLDYEEMIVYRDASGRIRTTPIGRYVEERLSSPHHAPGTDYQRVSGDTILSFNPYTREISEERITQVSRHDSNEVFEITLDDGTHVRLSGDHNCYVFDRGVFTLSATRDLRIGDHLPLARATLAPITVPTMINLLDYNPEAKLSIRTFLQDNRINDQIVIEALQTESRSPKNKLRQITEGTKNRGVSRASLERLASTCGIPVDDAFRKSRIITKGSDTTPAVLDIDRSFLRFCGLYVAEGYQTDSAFIISNGQLHLQDLVTTWCMNHGITARKQNENDVWCYSQPVRRFLARFGTNARAKHVPDLFYNLSNEQLGAFLQGIFDGDGGVEHGGVCLTSASHRLIDDLRRLLLRYDITSRTTSKRVQSSNYVTLRISGAENLQRFAEHIGFSIPSKSDALRIISTRRANTNVDLVPGIGPTLRILRAQSGLTQRETGALAGCRASHVSLIEHGHRTPSQTLVTRLSSSARFGARASDDLGLLSTFNFRRIESIERTAPSTPYVYDIAVARNNTFATGAANLFIHNTFVMANVIEKLKRPTIVIAHNKILAAQLYQELRELFPKNRVEYFISYYDYYQPESYIATSDTYIEKEATINEEIEKMRLHTTSSLMSREDVIVVASISCIYGLGNPDDFLALAQTVKKGSSIDRDELITKLIEMQYERSDPIEPGRFRVRGDVIDVIPGYDDSVIRIELFGDEVDRIGEYDHVTMEKITDLDEITIYPAKQYVVPDEKMQAAIAAIKAELETRLPELPVLEAQRLRQRTKFDIEMIEEMGYCRGIENYSRHFDGRSVGEPPFVLLDYFPDDYLMIIDESHQTIPQSRAMYAGDKSRKDALVEYGFRLPSAYDNRPLTFDEFEGKFDKVLYVSATPAEYERERSAHIEELIIRPTGLLDPTVELRPIEGQVKDLIGEINTTTERGDRVLVTTLTKRMAEDLTNYLAGEGINVRYMHSDIDSLDRIELVRQLRAGDYDVLVGINLLREGLDIPEVSLVAVLDADKEGFLRDRRSLIQTMGRAARNVNGRVILYADNETDSIKHAVATVRERRAEQEAFNEEHGIEPKTIRKKIAEQKREVKGTKHLAQEDLEKTIADIDAQMRKAAQDLDFEKAIELRERLKALEAELEYRS